MTTLERASRQATDDWDQHWKEFGSAAEFGPTPKYRRQIILRLLGIGARDSWARVFEIGSGTGEFADLLLRRSPRIRYLGFELSRRGVEESARRVPSGTFIQRDLLEKLTVEHFADFNATHAVCSEVLEHLDDPKLLLQNASRYMAPGCRSIFTVPGGPMCAFYRRIGHRRHYSPAELSSLLESSGFNVEESYGAGWPFFNLFRLLITWRGNKLTQSISGSPSAVIRLGMAVFNVLFQCNLMRWGWQTVVVARFRGTQ